MCGICGIVSLAGNEPSDDIKDTVAAMVAAVTHRGPDEHGMVTSGSAVLGATRLAIRGLQDGAQPLVESESGIVVVCNGEIDNHKELREWLASRGRPVEMATDVAVIPGLYLELGDAFVERLVGVFALAVWDPRGNRLLLARDRAGERPLFFAAGKDEVRFSTEISGFALDRSFPLEISVPAVAGYIESGCFFAPASPFAGIQKVGPAEIVAISADGLSRRRYWHWNIRNVEKIPHPSLDAFDEIFRGAVRKQTDVDVEYGVFLSGGLDSSLVAAVTKSVRPGYALKGYTLRFCEPSYDEGEYAERIARELGIPLATVLVKAEMVPAEIARIVRMVGEPLADQSWVPTVLLAQRAAQEAKLALVGEGSDELFGGYPTYIGARVGEHYARLPGWFKRGFTWAVEKWPPSDKKVSFSFLLKRFVQGWEYDAISRHLLWTANISPPLLERLGVAPASPREVDRSYTELLDAIQELDLETSLAEGLLMEKDHGSMSCALELRTPFLDKDVLEFAASLPVNERVRGVTTKAFLKRYSLRYLPHWVVHRKKRGLSVPFNAWLRDPLYDWARSRLDSELLEEAGVNRKAAVELLQENHDRVADHGRALWTLIVLSEWLEWVSTLNGGAPLRDGSVQSAQGKGT